MSGYAKLYREAVANTDLLKCHNAALVYMYVLTYARYKPKRCSWGTLEIGECDSTQKQIAAAIGLSRRQVQACEKTLLNMGLLRARTGNRRRVLSLVEPSSCDDDGARSVPETVESGAQNVPEACSNGARSVHSIEGDKGEGSEGENKESADADVHDHQQPPPKPKAKGKPKPLKDRMAQLDKSVQTEAFQAYWQTYQQQVRPGGAPNWRRTWCAWEDCNGEEHADEIMAGLRAYAARVAAEAQDGKRFAYSAYRWLDERIWESMADAGAPNQAVSAVRWQSEPLSFE